MLREKLLQLFNRHSCPAPDVDLDHLTRLLRRFSVEQQQVPKDLADLVALKYLDNVPIPPQGRRFVVDRKSVEVKLE